MRNAFNFLKGPLPDSLLPPPEPTTSKSRKKKIKRAEKAPEDELYTGRFPRWTAEQDELLLHHVRIHGTSSWKRIEKSIGFWGAKDRYDCLKSAKLGKWSYQEELDFVQHVQAILSETGGTQSTFNSFTLLASRMGDTRTYREVSRHFKLKPPGYFSRIPSPPPPPVPPKEPKRKRKVLKSSEYVIMSDEDNEDGGGDDNALALDTAALDVEDDGLSSASDSDSDQATDSASDPESDADSASDQSSNISNPVTATTPNPHSTRLSLYKDLLDRLHCLFPSAVQESDIDWAAVVRPDEPISTLVSTWRSIVSRAAMVWDIERMEVGGVVRICLENIKRVVDIEDDAVEGGDSDDDD